MSDTTPMDHRTEPPVTALGPDIDDDSETITDGELDEADTVEGFLAPGETGES